MLLVERRPREPFGGPVRLRAQEETRARPWNRLCADREQGLVEPDIDLPREKWPSG